MDTAFAGFVSRGAKFILHDLALARSGEPARRRWILQRSGLGASNQAALPRRNGRNSRPLISRTSRMWMCPSRVRTMALTPSLGKATCSECVISTERPGRCTAKGRKGRAFRASLMAAVVMAQSASHRLANQGGPRAGMVLGLLTSSRGSVMSQLFLSGRGKSSSAI